MNKADREGLAPAALGDPPLARAVVIVIFRIDLAHRRLARPLFVRVRDQSGQT